MKHMPDTQHRFHVFTNISLQNSVFIICFWYIPPNNISKHAKLKLFLIEAASMPSTQTKILVKPLDKKQWVLFFVSLQSILISIHLIETVLQHSPGQAASKSCWLTCFILKTPKILCVFAQDVPCKFAIALGFENNTCKESSDINWCIKQPNAFMSSLLQKMLIRVYLTSHQLEINSLPSFIGPRW